MKYLLIFISIFVSLHAYSKTTNKIKFMTYNVENLFDTTHDVGKNDWTFTPAGPKKRRFCNSIGNPRYRRDCFEINWTKENLGLKLNQIKKVVISEGSLPDILAVVEVENENVVSMLSKNLGYSKYIVTNSPDKRGIDVALLFNQNKKLKFIESKEHKISGSYFKRKPTRNILEVRFIVDNKYPLIVFVNHWPSQGNPSHTRIQAAELLKKLMDNATRLNSKARVIATGDFNTIDSDYPHPIKSVLYDGINKIYDLHDKYSHSDKISYFDKKKMSLGTYFYGPKMSWNLLDRFFVNKKMLSRKGLRIDISSYKIVNPSFIKTIYKYGDKKSPLYESIVKGTPKRYDFSVSSSKEIGYSDHFPIVVDIKF